MTPDQKQFFEPEPKSFVVRDLEERDISNIIPILQTWIRDSETHEVIAEEIFEVLSYMKESMQIHERFYVVADTSGKVIGVGGVVTPDETMKTFTQTSNPCELKNMYVAEGQRGRGVGRAIIEKLIQEAQSQGFTEMVLNSGPRFAHSWGFYDSLEGFKRVGMAENYYGEGVSAPVWIRKLV